jgi:DNA-binding CsgD family transcriptional regulator
VDDVVHEMAAAAAPLTLLAIYPEEVLDNPGITKTLFGPDIPMAVRKEFETEIAKNGASALALHARTNPAPFTFVKAAEHLRLRGADRWLLNLISRHGWHDGLYVPLAGWMVAYISKQVLGRLDDEIRLALVAVAAMGAAELALMTRRMRKRFTDDDLSVRELEVLRHLAQGADRAKAARLLGVTKSTVEVFLRRAKKKLGAKTDPHAVAIALRKRLI